MTRGRALTVRVAIVLTVVCALAVAIAAAQLDFRYKMSAIRQQRELVRLADEAHLEREKILELLNLILEKLP